MRGPLVAHVTVRLLPHVYQLRSARCWKELRRATTTLPDDWVDPYSTAACFDGWRVRIAMPRWGPGSRPTGYRE